MVFTIKQVSEITGFPPSTLRYYEKEKILPPVKRNSSGNRIYSNDDLEWISIINCLKKTNMPINEIKEFVSLSVQGDSTLEKRLNIVLNHQENIKCQIAELCAYQKHIDFKAKYYRKACEAGTEDSVRNLYKTNKYTSL